MLSGKKTEVLIQKREVTSSTRGFSIKILCLPHVSVTIRFFFNVLQKTYFYLCFLIEDNKQKNACLIKKEKDKILAIKNEQNVYRQTTQRAKCIEFLS